MYVSHNSSNRARHNELRHTPAFLAKRSYTNRHQQLLWLCICAAIVIGVDSVSREAFAAPTDHVAALHVPEVESHVTHESWSMKLRWLVIGAIIVFCVHTLGLAATEWFTDKFGRASNLRAAAGFWISTDGKKLLVMPFSGEDYLLCVGRAGYRLRPETIGENHFAGAVDCLRHHGNVGDFKGDLTNIDNTNVIKLVLRIGENRTKTTSIFTPAI